MFFRLFFQWLADLPTKWPSKADAFIPMFIKPAKLCITGSS
jgi:hypothetical protein